MTTILFMVLFAALVFGFLAVALLQGTADTTSAAQLDLDIYKGQLKDLERDISRGIVTEDEAQTLRTEIARRILDANKRLDADKSAPIRARLKLVPLAIVAGAIIISAAFYASFGTFDYPDMPLKQRKEMASQLRDDRLSQKDYVAALPPAVPLDLPDNFITLVERLRTAVASRPDDIQGLKLLAQNEARLGNFDAAIAAQGKLIATKGNDAAAEDYADLGELYVNQAGGYISPEAENAVTAAYRRDENNPRARFYLGLMFYQTGRPDTTFRIWAPLLESSAPSDPWYEFVSANIMEMAAWAGESDYERPAPMATALRGPSREDMAAAAEMSEDDRASFIASMVEQLNTRLAQDGGTASEWAQLISALGVLGRTEQAQAVFAEAQTVFAARPDDLETIRNAAKASGLSQ